MLLLLLCVLWAAQFFGSSFLLSKHHDSVEQLLRWHLAKNLATQMEPFLQDPIDYTNLRKTAHEATRTYQVIDVFLLDREGNLIANFTEAWGKVETHTIDPEPIRRFLADTDRAELPIYGGNPNVIGEEVIFSAAPVMIAGTPGYVYVLLQNEVLYSLRRLLYENSTIRAAVAGLVLVLCITALVGFLLFYSLTRRFYQITSTVQEFARGDFSKRVKAQGDDEIGAHATAVNSLADRIVENIGELESRDQRRRELLADISHDLRQPVTIISACTEQFLDAGRPDSDRAGLAEKINRTTRSLTRLLEELFELSKLEAKETKPAAELFEIEALLGEIGEAFAERGRKQGVAVEIEIADGVRFGRGDIAMLGRVVLNLLDNALRYTPAGGKVFLRARNEQERVRIEVADTGSGISAEALPHVFDRFYQSATPAEGGHGLSGLGLAIVKRIVEAHGGEISVASQPGSGTTFAFTVPRG